MPEIRERPPSTKKISTAGPQTPVVEGGGGSDLHKESGWCVVNLYEYETQKVILLMGLTFPAPGPAMAYDP
jgi:hypothetical protein